MARESIFARKRKEKGKEWLKVTNPSELIKISENILSDIAFGNLSSNEDKWTMVDPIVLGSLYEFCGSRAKNLYYLCVSMQKHRDTSDEATNLQNSVLFDNLCKSLELYNSLIVFIDGYSKTNDPSYMVNMYAKLAELKNFISPGKLI